MSAPRRAGRSFQRATISTMRTADCLVAARKHGAGEACGENHARGVSRPAEIAVRFIAGQAANLRAGAKPGKFRPDIAGAAATHARNFFAVETSSGPDDDLPLRGGYASANRRIPALPYPPLRCFQSGSTATSPAIVSQRTAITPLTSCLTPGVHFKCRPLPLHPIPRWQRRYSYRNRTLLLR